MCVCSVHLFCWFLLHLKSSNETARAAFHSDRFSTWTHRVVSFAWFHRRFMHEIEINSSVMANAIRRSRKKSIKRYWLTADELTSSSMAIRSMANEKRNKWRVDVKCTLNLSDNCSLSQTLFSTFLRHFDWSQSSTNRLWPVKVVEDRMRTENDRRAYTRFNYVLLANFPSSIDFRTKKT